MGVEMSRKVGSSKALSYNSEQTGFEEVARDLAQARIQSDAAALAKLNELSSRLWNMQGLREGLEEMLFATVELLSADFGNIQILNAQRRVLLIEAQRGFEKEFLEFFREVSADDNSACGRALRTGERIIVENVETDPDFAPMLHIVRNAGFCAVQSPPIIGRHGQPLGMISTHFRSVHRPTENELRLLDLYARQAADFIEHKQAESLNERQKQLLELVVAGAALEGDGGILDFLARSMEPQLDGAIIATHLLEHDGYHFGYVAAPSLPPRYAQAIRGMDARQELGCWSSAVVSHSPTIVRDFAEAAPKTQWSASITEMLALGLRSCFTTPIISAEKKVLGTFSIYYREPREPIPRDHQLADFVTSTLSLAIERKRAEKALRESEKRFRMLADNMAQLAWTCDTLGNVTWYNQRWLEYTGMSFEEIKDWGWTRCVDPDHVERVVASITHSRESCDIWEDTFPLRAKDGSYRWFLSRALPIREENNIVCWFGTNTDIEDLKQAREAAETANRIKDDFLATVSHELRTPLNAIIGWTHLLTRGKLDEETSARGLATIARNASAQNQLISDLLDVSRISSGQLRFESGIIDLIPVIEAATETVRPAADSAGIMLRLKLDPEGGMVSGDGMRLQQIVWNLLSNAIKFTPRGGEVTVRLKRESTNVVLSVSDTGEGISAEFLPYIFDRFRQAERTRKSEHGGLGLGLAIVRHLVEAHGGSISAASKGVGKGATFTVMFPLVAIANLAAEASIDAQ
jgi:PAS domain S-box-containing protein